MFGFPLPLYDSGNSGVKLTNNADSGFPKPNIGETFYSIKSGLWDDITVWQTASGRVGLLPTANDDVYVRNTITITGSATPFNCYNLFITGILSMNNRQLNIYGNFKNLGTVNSGLSIGFNSTIALYSNDNILGIINDNGYTVINYASDLNQTILPYSYNNLTVSGNGIKTLITNAEIGLNLSIRGILDCSYSNLTVNGSTTIVEGGTFRSSGAGSHLFKGAFASSITSPVNVIYLDLTGNPNMEFRGGFIVAGSNTGFIGTTGTGTWSFTTNNQNLSITAPQTFNCKVLIGSGVTLTRTSTNTNVILNLNDTINGVDGTSKLLMGANSPIINFATQLAAENSMSVGIIDFTTNANTVQFNGNYSATIPSYFTTFSSLTIGGTGTKTLGVNTTLNGNLTINNGGTFDSSIYTLTVNGTTTCTGSTPATIKNTGGGSVLFVGAVVLSTSFTDNGYLDFSGGNPNVECRNGIAFNRGYSNTTNCGTGTWTFSTNNQSIIVSGGGGASTAFFYNILISGAITLTNTLGSGGTGLLRINNTLNGNNASSKFLQGTSSNVGFINATAPMVIGIFDCTTNANIVTYLGNSTYSIPSSIPTFSSLTVSGTSGTISISTNTTLNGSIIITSGIIFNTLSYTLIVNGTTLVTGSSTFANTGGGAITFIGNVNFSTFNSGTDGSSINFSGNPNVEVRNGISFSRGYVTTYNCGTGTWTFTTNNQNIFATALYGGTTVIMNNVVISGAITVTNTSGATVGVFQINGSLNGNNAASTFTQGASTVLSYRAATQPMATGILDTSTNLNTWIYGLGNQDIKGNIIILTKQVYRNLTLNGGGTKTLLGFVSVLNTYTLTPPATVLLNGFTITNP